MTPCVRVLVRPVRRPSVERAFFSRGRWRRDGHFETQGKQAVDHGGTKEPHSVPSMHFLAVSRTFRDIADLFGYV